jgi:2,3-bisphosphoglycerate-independent phosphoglycerate mutase
MNKDYTISCVSGRYFAMDRDNNWDRIQKAWLAINEGSGPHCDKIPSDFIGEKYSEGERDELLSPFVCKTEEGYGIPIKENDGIFYFNFRADRARELSQKILEIKDAKKIFFVTMTQYKQEFDAEVVFPPLFPDKTLGKIIAENGLKQVHIAETEKYAHATYFLNGGQEKPNTNEEDILIQSRQDIATHDQAPEMRAKEITEKAIEKIDAGADFVFINYANADMVGHTANAPAIIKAVEFVDSCLGTLYRHIEEKKGVLMITADHGNAEENADPITHQPSTDHTTNPVPCILTDDSITMRDGVLSDVAPTILNLMNLEVPKEMTGKSLFLRK